MQKIDCIAGVAMCLLMSISLIRIDGFVSALEPEDEVIIEEVVEEPTPIEIDYALLADACYNYVRDMNFQVVERVGMEFADGFAVNRNEDFLYYVDTVYFPDSLMIRFVGSQGRLTSVLANPDRVCDMTTLSQLSYPELHVSAYEISYLLAQLAANVEENLVLEERQKFEYYFGNPHVRQKIETSVAVGESVTVNYVNLGKSSKDLGYNDSLLVQLGYGSELLTLLLNLDDACRVVNIDVI